MRYVIAKSKLTAEVSRFLARLDKQCFPYDTPEPIDDERTWWIAWQVLGKNSRLPVGFCASRPSVIPQHAYFCRAGVLTAHRRQGIYRRLIAASVSQARKDDYLGVLTYTSRENTASANALVSCGFKLYVPKYEYAGPAHYLIREF
jgi:ribosomal protein S18 acetylase RimI-like enzyme